jgi:hypothetical protein
MIESCVLVSNPMGYGEGDQVAKEDEWAPRGSSERWDSVQSVQSSILVDSSRTPCHR